MWSLLGGMLCLTVRTPKRFAAWAIFGTVSIGTIGYLVFLRGIFIPVVPPAFAWFTSAGVAIAYMSFREAEDRRALMTLFGRHVSKDVAKTIWNKRDEFIEKGRLIAQEMTATVLFTDLKGFSAVSETMTPGVLMNWLNDYFQSMSGLVEQHGGSISKFNGDSIMALFGPPLVRTTPEELAADVSHAIDCALQMRKKLAEMNANWQSQKPPKPTTQMRIGICTGPLVAGSLGSKERLEYTVIGDTVNVASRLESFDKNLMDEDIAACGCRILISDSTMKRTVGQYQTRPIGSVHLHGKKEEVLVHGVIGRSTPAQMAQQNLNQRSETPCEAASSNPS
jgi:adenylate cyclase